MAIDTSVLNIDFDVNHCSTNCKVLQVSDLSNWGPATNNIALISITTPGSNTPVENIFQKHKVNVFNSNNLNLSDVTDYSSLGIIPDGVYKICVKTCITPNIDPPTSPPTIDFEETCKYVLFDCSLRCRVSREIISIDLNCSPCRATLLAELQDVLLFLDAAQAQVANCNATKAMELYRKASQLLDRISLNPGKPCHNCNQ